MLVTELRQRLMEKVAQVSSEGDEATTATVLAHARAALIALARYPGDGDIALHELTVGTRTAALILGLHPEYVRFLIRRGRLQGKKEDGEYRIPLHDIADFAATGMQSLSSDAQRLAQSGDMLTGAKGSTVIWQRSQ